MSSPDYERMAWIAQKMRLLIETSEFDEYIKLLEAYEQERVERVLTDGKEEHGFNTGFVMGLRYAAHLPGEMLKHWKKMQDSEPARVPFKPVA